MPIAIRSARRCRNRPISHMHAAYTRLRNFRISWEAGGGTRGTLRKARKEQRTLFPTAAV